MSNWNELFEIETKHFANSLLSFKENEWSLPFCQYAVLMSNVALSFVATSISEGNEKSTEIDSKKFNKRLGKMKRKDIQSLIKFFLMDYIVWLTEEPKKVKHILLNGHTVDDVKNALFTTLRFTKNDFQLFLDVQENFQTIKHSRMILTKLGAGKSAYIEYLVDTVEEVKNEFYTMMDKRFNEITKSTG